MIDIKTAENLLPLGYANDIERDLESAGFPWFYVNDVTNPDTYGAPGLSNSVYEYSLNNQTEYYRYLKPVTYFIEEVIQQRITKLLRIRIGFLQPHLAGYNLPHLDFLLPHMTACYYVNDSDGDTVLFDKNLSDIPSSDIDFKVVQRYAETTKFQEVYRCTPTKNKLCVFNGHRFHASTHPTSSRKRFVITFNFTV